MISHLLHRSAERTRGDGVCRVTESDVLVSPGACFLFSTTTAVPTSQNGRLVSSETAHKILTGF